MKKSLGLLAGLLCAMLILFCGCNTTDTIQIPERPEDTNLEFWIADNVTGYDWNEYEGAGGFSWGVREYYGKGYERIVGEDGNKVEREYYVIYSITSWPDYSDIESHITGITITDPAVMVYGLTVNSTIEEFDAVFQEKGYELYNWGSNYLKARGARKNGFVFSLSEQEHVIRIGATVTNRDNMVF